MILAGLGWIDTEATNRFSKRFHELSAGEAAAICDQVCYLPRAKPEHADAARFFALFRDLTAGGFYTTPEGMRDLQYVGNVPLVDFPGPPDEALRKVGLA